MVKVCVVCSSMPIKFKGVDPDQEWLNYHALHKQELSFDDEMDTNAGQDEQIERILNKHQVPESLRHYLAIVRFSDNTIILRSI